MVSVGLIIFIVILVIVVCVVIVGIVLIITSNNSSDDNNDPVKPPLPNCNEIDPVTLPNISNFPNCSGSAQKYVNNLEGIDYDLVVGPSVVNWFTVCRGFCIQGWDNQLNQCINQTGQSNFDRCEQQIKPQTCQNSPAQPLFNNNNRLYYANSAGDSLC